MSLTDAPLDVAASERLTQRLLVSRQDHTGMYLPVGFLEARTGEDGMDEYSFAYLQRAANTDGFRTFLGFRELRRYTSPGLFPLFAERLMDPRRPDRPQFLAALALDEEAAPLTVLSRSAGQRNGDGIELSPVPVANDDGFSSCIFLVHGVRYLPDAAEHIATLHDGDALLLRDDPTNHANPEAMHVAVADTDGTEVGWVPNVLLDYVRHLEHPEVRVQRVNGPEVGPRLRLLVRVQGMTTPCWSPFDGDEWRTVD